MKKFADIEVSSINTLNLGKLRHVRAKFAEEIMQHFDRVSHSNDDVYKQAAKEIDSYKGFNVIKHLENYDALKEHEVVLRHASLFDHTTQPSLDQLMLLAHKHAPDDWRAKLYLQEDIEMIRSYKLVSKTYSTDAQTYTDAVKQTEHEQKLISNWEVQLRNHYMAAHYMNMSKINQELDKIAKLYKKTNCSINEPYACAVQIVHLISIYEYLLLNASENKNMIAWCNKVIHFLDVAIGVLKALPEVLEERTQERKAKTFMQYFYHKQFKFADETVVGNLVQVKQLQNTAFLN